jgi:PAS domain S-box-containing protein
MNSSPGAKNAITLGVVALMVAVNFYLYTHGLTAGYYLLLLHLCYPLVVIGAICTNYVGMLTIVIASSVANFIHLYRLFDAETLAAALSYPPISFLIGHLIVSLRGRQVKDEMKADSLYRKEAAEMSTLYQMSITLTSLTSLNAILRSMMRILADELGMERGRLSLVELGRLVGADGNTPGAYDRTPLRVEAVHGFAAGEAHSGHYNLWDESERRAASTGKPEIISGRGYHPRGEGRAEENEVSFYCLPIKVRGEAIGVLSLEKAVPRGLSYRDDLRFLEIVSSIIGQVIQINRMLVSIRDMALYNDNILDSMASGIVVLDMEGRVTIFNRAAEAMTGIARSEALGKPFSTLLAGQERLSEPIRRTLEDGEVSINLEVPLSDGNGREASLSLSTSMLKDSEGRVIGAVASFNDISQVKKLEEDIKRADRLSAAGEMAAGLAHEIRNPLSGLRGSAQLLISELGEDDPRSEYAQVIVEESDRVERIIRKLLDLAKPIRPSFKEGDVNKILADTLSFVLRSVRGDGNFKIVKELDPSIPPIMLDEEGLRGAFMNILLNSFQAMQGGGLLRLRTELDGEGSTVKITIADTGPGIPPEDREKVFNPFYTRKVGGTGLGLSVTGRIIAEHGGSIVVESEPGKGAAFVISLPVAGVKNR